MTSAERDTVAAALMKAKLETSGKPYKGWAYAGSWTFCVLCGAPTQSAWACDPECWRQVGGKCTDENKPARFTLPAEIVALLPEFIEEGGI